MWKWFCRSEGWFPFILRLIVFYLVVEVARKYFQPIILELFHANPLKNMTGIIEDQFLRSASGRIFRGLWTVCIYVIWIKTIEKSRLIPNVLFPQNSKIIGYVKGIGIGLFIIIPMYFFILFSGAISVHGIQMSYSWILVDLIMVWVLSTFGVIHEELMCRGYYLESLSFRFGPNIGCILQGIFFGLMHWGGRGVEALHPSYMIGWLIAGWFLGYVYLYYKNIYTCFAVHTVIHLNNLLYSDKIFNINIDWDSYIFSINNTVPGVLLIGCGLVIYFIRFQHKQSLNV